jgi:L-threonylcarbamoyladenylate synthase
VVLEQGGVCVVPTDTLYGLVALDSKPEAVRRIYRIKERPPDKPLIRLIGSSESVTRYSDQEVPPRLGTCWPGPLTIIFRARSGGTIALRCPDDPFLQELFRRTGGEPIVAPSANLSGREDIRSCEDLVQIFSGKVELIVCLRSGPRTTRPSTIVDVSGDEWKLLRAGAADIQI